MSSGDKLKEVDNVNKKKSVSSKKVAKSPNVKILLKPQILLSHPLTTAVHIPCSNSILIIRSSIISLPYLLFILFSVQAMPPILALSSGQNLQVPNSLLALP